MLKLAIPNGHLEKDTLSIMKKAGLAVIRNGRSYNARIDDPLISGVIITRPQSIPRLIEKGICDVGISGWDCVLETFAHRFYPYGDWVTEERMKEHVEEKFVKVVCGLDDSPRFERINGKTVDTQLKLVVVGGIDNPAEFDWDIKSENTVYSEYPKYTKWFLEKYGHKVKIVPSVGSTEAHVPKEFPYGVCIVQTGKTLKKNNLKIIYPILAFSHTVLIANKTVMKLNTKSRIISVLGDLLEEASRDKN